jgi:hypothetical protein
MCFAYFCPLFFLQAKTCLPNLLSEYLSQVSMPWRRRRRRDTTLLFRQERTRVIIPVACGGIGSLPFSSHLIKSPLQTTQQLWSIPPLHPQLMVFFSVTQPNHMMHVDCRIIPPMHTCKHQTRLELAGANINPSRPRWWWWGWGGKKRCSCANHTNSTSLPPIRHLPMPLQCNSKRATYIQPSQNKCYQS